VVDEPAPAETPELSVVSSLRKAVAMNPSASAATIRTITTRTQGFVWL
jgi:hypothetical protein